MTPLLYENKKMAPISLKDPNIQAITEEFVKVMTGFKKSSRNFTLSVQFALSNFRYHQFLDVNSLKVERDIDGVCQKLKVHSQTEKAEILRSICDRFLNLPLTSNSQDIKTDAHYSLLLLLLNLSDSPTNVVYTPPPQEHEPEEEWFDWKSYLLDGEEEEILGIPSEHYQEWSDEEDDELEVTKDSGISLDELRPTLPQPQVLKDVEHSVREREITTFKPSSRDGGWISDHIVDQYWQEPARNLNHTDTSESRNCSVAESWESYQRECNPFYSRNSNKTLTETQIVRETLWMLSGVQNTFVYSDIYHHGVLSVRDTIQVLHLTPECLFSLLSTFLVAGQKSLSLQKFVSSVLNPQIESTQTLQAFATALSCYFKEYKALLSSIEKDIIKQEVPVSLLLLQNKLKKTLDEINTLFRIYQAVFVETEELNNAQKTCRLLTTLYRSIGYTDRLGSSAKWKVCLLLKVFLQTVEPCLSFIDEWVMSGRVCDPHNEFFIERIHDVSVDSSSFWSNGVVLRSSNHLQKPVVPCFLQSVVNQIFRAGKSVELTQGLGKMGELYSRSIKGSLYLEFLDELLTSVSRNVSSQESDINNTDKGSLLDTVASSDQVLSVIKDAGDHVLKLSFIDSSPHKQSLFSLKGSTAQKLESICSGVSDLLKPVEMLLCECLTPLIEECCVQASNAIVHLMKTDFFLLDHLAAMRNFFLLEAGDAMHQFYVEIFNKARWHDSWQDISFLNGLIQEALQPRFPQALERLMVSLSGSNSTSRKQLGQSLQGLALNYRAPWPVNIIIDGSCQKLYNLVFLFLLKVKQAKWSLDELRFSDLQDDKRLQETSDTSDEEESETKSETTDSGQGAPDQEVLHKMFVFRFKLMQFINSIHNHFMTRILHSTGLEFQEALDQAKNLDDLIEAHSSYVEKVYDRCLLSPKVVYLREVILKVLNLVLLFQSYWDNGAQHMSLDKFKKIDEEFTKCNTFLISCLENIVKRGAFPHLESLAFALSSSPSLPSSS